MDSILEVREIQRIFLRKLAEVAEKNKLWKDLVLGLNTPASTSTRSSPFTVTTTQGSVHLIDLVAAAAQRLGKDYGLHDLLSKHDIKFGGQEGYSPAQDAPTDFAKTGLSPDEEVETKASQQDYLIYSFLMIKEE